MCVRACVCPRLVVRCYLAQCLVLAVTWGSVDPFSEYASDCGVGAMQDITNPHPSSLCPTTCDVPIFPFCYEVVVAHNGNQYKY